MGSESITSPARRLVLGCRRQAEQRLRTLGLPSRWPDCLDLLDTHQVPESDESGRSLFYSRKEVIDETQADAKAFGLKLPAEKTKKHQDNFEIYEDNWDAVMIFCNM